jgi:TRAP-type C4-dicarboxylate transport system permease small subunit
LLKRFDDGLARGEAAIAAFVLLVMIVLAALQALLHNIASGFGAVWANDALGQLDWIDTFLQKGTLWLAFIGASLATHADKHISIDVLHRIVPGRPRALLRGVSSLGAAVVAFYLARVFFATVVLAGAERPLDYEALTADGPMHICDAPDAALAEADLARPAMFCVLRGALTALGAPVETVPGALQIIVPVMFLLISVRLLSRSIIDFRGFARGDGEGH